MSVLLYLVLYLIKIQFLQDSVTVTNLMEDIQVRYSKLDSNMKSGSPGRKIRKVGGSLAEVR